MVVISKIKKARFDIFAYSNENSRLLLTRELQAPTHKVCGTVCPYDAIIIDGILTYCRSPLVEKSAQFLIKEWKKLDSSWLSRVKDSTREIVKSACEKVVNSNYTRSGFLFGLGNLNPKPAEILKEGYKSNAIIGEYFRSEFEVSGVLDEDIYQRAVWNKQLIDEFKKAMYKNSDQFELSSDLISVLIICDSLVADRLENNRLKAFSFTTDTVEAGWKTVERGEYLIKKLCKMIDISSGSELQYDDSNANVGDFVGLYTSCLGSGVLLPLLQNEERFDGSLGLSLKSVLNPTQYEIFSSSIQKDVDYLDRIIANSIITLPLLPGMHAIGRKVEANNAFVLKYNA